MRAFFLLSFGLSCLHLFRVRVCVACQCAGVRARNRKLKKRLLKNKKKQIPCRMKGEDGPREAMARALFKKPIHKYFWGRPGKFPISFGTQEIATSFWTWRSGAVKERYPWIMGPTERNVAWFLFFSSNILLSLSTLRFLFCSSWKGVYFHFSVALVLPRRHGII